MLKKLSSVSMTSFEMFFRLILLCFLERDILSYFSIFKSFVHFLGFVTTLGIIQPLRNADFADFRPLPETLRNAMTYPPSLRYVTLVHSRPSPKPIKNESIWQKKVKSFKNLLIKSSSCVTSRLLALRNCTITLPLSPVMPRNILLQPSLSPKCVT